MSADKLSLKVNARDGTAEITVYDGSFKQVGRGVGSLDVLLRKGIYEVRARVGGAVETQLVSVPATKPVEFVEMAFATPLPDADDIQPDVDQTSPESLAMPPPGGLGSLRIGIRERSEEAPGPDFVDLALIWPDGHSDDLVGTASGHSRGRTAIAFISIPPGNYRLALRRGDDVRLRGLVVRPGWITECFMVRRRQGEMRLPDIARASVALRRSGQEFVASEAVRRASELGIEALTNNRKVADAVLDTLTRQKFQNPMLGLVAAHLLLRDKPSSKMLGEVTRNLVTLLGEDNPDVQAISLAVKGDGAPLRDMPMLRASWDIFVNASLRKPDLVPPDSLPANLAPYVLPAWPWLIWEAPEAGGQRRLNAKLLALRGYLEGGDRSRAVEPEAVDFAVPRQAAARGASLDAEEQAELAQALGVPRNVLDRLISDAGY